MNTGDIVEGEAEYQAFLKSSAMLAEHAVAIRTLGKRMIADVVEIGRRLTECQEIVGHGGWAAWLDANFSWSDRTARNFMHAFELAKSEKFSDLSQVDLPISALYLLAAPSTPETARTEIVDRAKAGESFSVEDIKKAIANKERLPSRKKAIQLARETGRPVEAIYGFVYLGSSKVRNRKTGPATQCRLRGA
jgi:hypothetical protein